MLQYIAWISITQMTTSTQSSTSSIKSPTTFNNSMNIKVLLQTVKENLNKSSISTNEQKQKCTMQYLDAQSQRIIQAKKDEGKIKTYTDLKTYLGAFFSNGDRSSLGDLVKLISRKQQPNESLA